MIPENSLSVRRPSWAHAVAGSGAARGADIGPAQRIFSLSAIDRLSVGPLPLWLLAAAGLWLSMGVPAARADENLNLDRSVGQFMTIDNEARAIQQGKDSPVSHAGPTKPGEPEAPQELSSSQNIAVLPQLGYDPSAGFIAGIKFSDINFGPSHANLDAQATQSTGGETAFDLTWGTPHLLGSGFIGIVHLRYQLQPTQSFYGLGNNSVGDDALSRHEQHATSVLFTLARRLAPHWVAAGTIGYDRVTIGPGKPHGKRSTTSAYPDLPGIHGGNNNPVSLSLIYNTQRDLTRPKQGWNVVGKIQHVGSELGNHFHYTRYIADASYVHPVFSEDHLIGVRVDGEYIDGRGQDLPFYEFASIGGFDSLEGFAPDRFLGQSRIFARVGYQTLLADFDFRDIWRVRLDGSLFAGAGRVFLNRSRLPAGLLQNEPQVAPGLSNRVQYSYGTGLRVALGEAVSARLEAGFSRETHGLIYLSFGNAF